MTPNRWSWLLPKPICDLEFVERLRRQQATLRRWRRWLIALYGACLLVFIALAILAANHAVELVELFANRWIVPGGFGIGLVTGVGLGHVGHRIALGLVSAISSHRTEELLLYYYDMNVEVTRKDPETLARETIV